MGKFMGIMSSGRRGKLNIGAALAAAFVTTIVVAETVTDTDELAEKYVAAGVGYVFHSAAHEIRSVCESYAMPPCPYPRLRILNSDRQHS